MAIYFIFFVVYNIQALYIFPERISYVNDDDRGKFKAWSIILDFVILLLNLYHIIHECCLAYYGKLYHFYLSVVGVIT